MPSCIQEVVCFQGACVQFSWTAVNWLLSTGSMECQSTFYVCIAHCTLDFAMEAVLRLGTLPQVCQWI